MGIKHEILTLDPNKFAEKNQKRLHLGNLKSFECRVWLPKQSIHVISSHMEYDLSSIKNEGPALYPPDTKAFLYYSIPPGKPRIAGELRLRFASSDDHASFENGSDLLRKNGHPWTRSLYSL